MCDTEVEIEGATCSLDCYRHLYAYVAQVQYVPDHWPRVLDLTDQPWYEQEERRIWQHAEEMQVDERYLY